MSSIMKGIVDEAKAKQYVKPYISPQTGEQIGWISSDGYHKKYWQMFAKNSAIKHAKLEPEQEVAEASSKFIVRSKDGVERGYSDPNSIGAQNWKDSYQQREKPFKPEKIKKPSSDEIWQKVEYVVGQIYPDGDPSDFLNPYLEKNNLTYDDVTRAARKNGYKDIYAYWDEIGLDSGNSINEDDLDEAKKSEFRQKVEQQQLAKLEKIKNSTLPHWAMEYLILLNDPKGKVFRAGYSSFPKGQAAREEAAQYIMDKYKVPKDMLNKVKRGEMAHAAMDRPEDRNYDFDVPSVHEEQLDEKCWSDYKQVGMKKKGGKEVPNCVPKESAIMKGITR